MDKLSNVGWNALTALFRAASVPVTAKSLGNDEYLVHVDYTIPTYEELEKEFGEGNVTDIFDGRSFYKHPSCAGIDETPGDRTFLVKRFDRKMGPEEPIVEMDKLGYRPATHLEAYAFAKAEPDLHHQLWIVSLGSYALRDDGHSVALLGGGRQIDCIWNDMWLDSDFDFLFVRK